MAGAATAGDGMAGRAGMVAGIVTAIGTVITKGTATAIGTVIVAGMAIAAGGVAATMIAAVMAAVTTAIDARSAIIPIRRMKSSKLLR